MTQSILIIKFGAIGDVVMAIPAAHALHLQGAKIDWVCSAAVAPVLACYPWIRPIVVDDQALLQGGTIARLKALIGAWRRLSGRRYDLCATLYYDSRYKLVSLPVRAGRKITLSKTDRAFRLLPGRHHTDEYARILLGGGDNYQPQSLTALRPELLPANPLGARRAAVRIGLVPAGASNMMRQQTLRRWPAESYAALARILLARGWEVTLLGGPDDGWVRSHFEGLAVDDRIGQLTLPEVVSACDACNAVVSHDTGPLHLAALSHTAILGLFGPTDPGSFLPRRPGVVGIWGGEGFACRPCYDGRDFAPCTNNVCMQQITVEMVMHRLEKLLENPAEPMRLILPSAALGDTQ